MSLERVTTSDETPWTGEHLHRYAESLSHVLPGDTVLDLACGSGYGTRMLATVPGTTVYGGDIDSDTISACRADAKPGESVVFEVVDATAMRFADDFFNCIVSLETIEHLTQYRQMLSEFKRTVKPGGTVVISTPNKRVSSPDGIVRNRFHTQEFYFDEFRALLNEYFADVTISGQRYIRYENQGGLMKLAERFFLLRGVRKIGYRFRNAAFRLIFKRRLYPQADDFALITDPGRIDRDCHVLFAVCRP